MAFPYPAVGTAWERSESGLKKTYIHVLVPSLHGLAVWGSQLVIRDGATHTAWSDTGNIYTERQQKLSKSLSLLVQTSEVHPPLPFLGRAGVSEMRQGLQQRLRAPLRLTQFPAWGGMMLYPSCLPRQAGNPTPGADLTFPTRKPAEALPCRAGWLEEAPTPQP